MRYARPAASALMVVALATTIGAQRDEIDPALRRSEGKAVLATETTAPIVGPEREARIRRAAPLRDAVATVQFVDEDDLRERKLALYRGEQPRSTLPRYDAAGERITTDGYAAAVAHVASADNPETESTRGWGFLAFIGLCGVAYVMARIRADR